jgi:hypothetical protein
LGKVSVTRHSESSTLALNETERIAQATYPTGTVIFVIEKKKKASQPASSCKLSNVSLGYSHIPSVGVEKEMSNPAGANQWGSYANMRRQKSLDQRGYRPPKASDCVDLCAYISQSPSTVPNFQTNPLRQVKFKLYLLYRRNLNA